MLSTDHTPGLPGTPLTTPSNPRPSVAASTLIQRGMYGRVEAPYGPLIVATDASVKNRSAGWGFVCTNGSWGCRGHHIHRNPLDPTPDRRTMVDVSELRAVRLALQELKRIAPRARATFLLDSTVAIMYLTEWQKGNIDAMPPGYSLRPRIRGDSKPALVELAEWVHRSRRLFTFEHVPGHSRHPLNEAADSLAGIARRCAAKEYEGTPEEVYTRADGLVGAFVDDWHTVAAA
jgi:ribonuclease HI